MAQNVNGVIMIQENTNSFRYRRKHERQSRSLTSGMFSIMGCGVLMTILFYADPKSSYDFQALYFAGVIVGSVISSISLKKLRKVIHYYLTALLVIISGALMIALKDSLSFDTFKAASFLSGLSFGISILTFIIHGGEISVKHLRGSLICNLQLGIDTALFIGTLITYASVNTSSNPLTIIGIFQVIFGILAVISAFFFVYESPIFLFEANNEQEAIKSLTELRKEPNSMTPEIHNEVENMRTILRTKSDSFLNEIIKNIIPFVKIFACRLAYTLGTSVLVNIYIVFYYSRYLLLTDGIATQTHTLYIGRFLAGFIPIFLIDKFLGRKLILVISFIGSGLFLLIIQCLMSSELKSMHPDIEIIKTAGLLCIIYNIFLGLGGSSVTYTYMSEIFGHSSKTFLNASIVILEYIIHIIIINCNFDLNSAETLIFFAGALQITFGVLSYALLPETKGTTLLEAQDKAKKLITIQS